jgi:predicted RecA/RadA family phage recombinase
MAGTTSATSTSTKARENGEMTAEGVTSTPKDGGKSKEGEKEKTLKDGENDATSDGSDYPEEEEQKVTTGTGIVTTRSGRKDIDNFLSTNFLYKYFRSRMD